MKYSDKIITIKDLIDEDFVNYKKPSMFIITSICDFKCQKEDPNVYCQNLEIVKLKNKKIKINDIINRYLKNNITKAIVFGGLEPIDQLEEMLSFITIFRLCCKDDIVIYTGYTEDELKNKKYNNKSILDVLLEVNQTYSEYNTNLNKLIIKYGRFKALDDEIFDNILGVKLASSNQYAKLYTFGDMNGKTN